MINFAIGPVQIEKKVREIGFDQVPYFRTQEFSEIMIENEKLVLKLINAPKNSKAVFITGSGTASMEAAIINTLSNKDKVLVINGGSFGQRFVDLLKLHKILYSEIKLDVGQNITKQLLDQYSNKGYTSLLVNIHETSTGVLYDINVLSQFCKSNNLFFIVDAISSFLADDFDMSVTNADVVIMSSQKALACHPGISIIALSPSAVERVNNCNCPLMYFDIKSMLNNQERGQTPFTCAITVLRQINYRLNEINNNGGAKYEINKIAFLSNYFRNRIKELPFDFITEHRSNALTALHPHNTSAFTIFEILKNDYDIWVAPNGGELKDYIFRVGHIGDLSTEDYDKLFDAFFDMQKKGIL